MMPYWKYLFQQLIGVTCSDDLFSYIDLFSRTQSYHS